ncbi:ribonuclease T2-like [Trichogramma pretiosum]|uniref:ribonuclease T2-like n=1 Tax=Trichogramma pretiosum TaxID=7493 RepID=UPI000C71B736|nr:ribonuclease T2-like [Trichogramma pretiosum]
MDVLQSNRNVDSETLVLDIFKVGKNKPKTNDIFYEKTFYDYLVLSLMWPQTNCYFYNSKDADNKLNVNLLTQLIEKDCSVCDMPSNIYKWTIHGLWPSNDALLEREKKGKIYSCHSEHNTYTTESISHLAEDLRINWISYNNQHSSNNLQRHEWKKHGTCTKRIQMDRPHSFFQETIKLYHHHDPSNLLEDLLKEKRDGDSYQIEDLRNVLKQKLATPRFICMKTTESNGQQNQYLLEIRICLDKINLQPIDCSNIDRNRCDDTKPVIYLANKRPCPGKKHIRPKVHGK